MKRIIMLTFLSCMFIFLLISCGQIMSEQPGTYLSDLKPLSSVGSYLKDISPEKHLIFVQGSKYEKGLCVSSNSGLLVFSVL